MNLEKNLMSTIFCTDFEDVPFLLMPEVCRGSLAT